MAVLSSPEYVSAGSKMTWTGQFPNFLVAASETPNDAIQKVSAYLRNNYHLVVERADNGITWGGAGSGSISLYLRTDIDRGDGEQDDGLSDILGNINQAFQSIGNPVLAAVINNYTPAGSHDTQMTNAPLPTVPEQRKQDAADNVPVNSGVSWWDSLVGKVEAGSVGIVVGGVVVLGLIIFLSAKSATTV